MPALHGLVGKAPISHQPGPLPSRPLSHTWERGAGYLPTREGDCGAVNAAEGLLNNGGCCYGGLGSLKVLPL